MHHPRIPFPLDKNGKSTYSCHIQFAETENFFLFENFHFESAIFNLYCDDEKKNHRPIVSSCKYCNIFSWRRLALLFVRSDIFIRAPIKLEIARIIPLYLASLVKKKIKKANHLRLSSFMWNWFLYNEILV